MLFSSVEFLFIFLPIVLLVFHFVRRYSPDLVVCTLFAASLLFYAYWNPSHLLLLIPSIIINYLLGALIVKSFHSKLILITGIVFNIALISVFKYAEFLFTSLNTIFDSNLVIPNILLPLAISFFTFQQISYLIDVYQKQITKSPSFFEYGLFVSFFPQLISGPIVLFKDVGEQIKYLKFGLNLTEDKIAQGIFLVVVGLFKKVIVADSLASYVDPVFSNMDQASFYDAWIALLSYSLQLYFDFSAYGDIAMGLGLVFGIQLPLNFDSPYKSRSIRQFWRTWHITLGRLMREYLYIPLGGGKNGRLRKISALCLTMFLGGLWHGAAWHYVIWGCLHGAYLSLHALWSKTPIRLPKGAATTVTLIAVVLSWVLFRADNLDEAIKLYRILFCFDSFSLPSLYSYYLPSIAPFNKSLFFEGHEIFFIISLWWFVLSSENAYRLSLEMKPNLKKVAVITATFLVVAFNVGTDNTFAYFNF